MRFPSTRRERGGGKKERRESTHTYARTRAAACACMRARVCTRALHGVCTGRKRTYVQKESRELGRETETERERGKRGKQGDGSCVCTTRRVYQATSVVTAIVPTTSPAGRHPRSIRLSSFPSRPPWSLASRRIASVSPPSWKPFLGVFFLVGDDPSLSSSSFYCFPRSYCLASFLFPVGAISVSTSGREVNSWTTGSLGGRVSLLFRQIGRAHV